MDKYIKRGGIKTVKKGEMLREEVRKIKEVPSIKPELLKVKIVHDYRATYTIH